MGSNLILPSSPTVGKADWLTAFSPIFFLRHDTWKIGWICTSASKSRRYATLPIHWSTWNGPQKRGDNDKFFQHRNTGLSEGLKSDIHPISNIEFTLWMVSISLLLHPMLRLLQVFSQQPNHAIPCLQASVNGICTWTFTINLVWWRELPVNNFIRSEFCWSMESSIIPPFS